jgi:YhcH/YjgK/YiaL family protein
MIYDMLENSRLYTQITPQLEKAFSFLQSTNLADLKPGRIELEGDSVYVMVQEYLTKPQDAGQWEAHKRYVDVQYIVSGSEKIGFAMLNSMQLGEYNPERDFQAMFGEGQFMTMIPGSFAVFFPQDAHMPGIAMEELAPVKKIVIKCAV